MSEYKKYQHVERFGTTETENIELGECYIFPKIDGTNAKIWCEGGVIKFGSRKRELSMDSDNAGFMNQFCQNKNVSTFFELYPELVLFGEFLVPHSLKDYRDGTWRKFYVFDVCEQLTDELPSGEKYRYLTYDSYMPLLNGFMDFITPLKIVKNPDYEALLKIAEENDYLMKPGCIGEGIVIKRYDYINKFGRTTWAKIVRSEFKEKHKIEMGASCADGKKIIEEEIVCNFLTDTFIEKEYAKISIDGWSSKLISKLLGVVWHEFIREEMFNIIKKYKNPKIDFKRLQFFVNRKIKEVVKI